MWSQPLVCLWCAQTYVVAKGWLGKERLHPKCIMKWPLRWAWTQPAVDILVAFILSWIWILFLSTLKSTSRFFQPSFNTSSLNYLHYVSCQKPKESCWYSRMPVLGNSSKFSKLYPWIIPELQEATDLVSITLFPSGLAFTELQLNIMLLNFP